MSEEVLLAHGSGGKLSHDLVEKSFLRFFRNDLLEKLGDSAVLELGGRLAFTTDSYVVTPLFFPGGDIGKLAVCGTVNDLAMSGAIPLYLSASFIIEEGLPIGELERIAASMRAAAEEAGVAVVAGDTKVVDRGSADRLFITTSGVGNIAPGVNIAPDQARPGNSVIISGSVGDHGITIMSQREGLRFSSELRSDCAPLGGLVSAMLETSNSINCLRDPTRGGLATVLNEIAGQSGVSIEVEETLIPVRDEVRAACELLGLDPFYVANEGKLVAIVEEGAAAGLVEAMRKHPYGERAAVIGRVREGHAGRVVLKTPYGPTRILDMLTGELLPRIC